MQSIKRQFGRFTKRSADESQISILLKDFDDADKLLTKLIDFTKAWRDSWSSLLTYQTRLATEFDGLYSPIAGSLTRDASPTPETALAKTNRLREEIEDLQKDLLQELDAVDQLMINPVVQAKDYISPMKKTIKKREDRKLDYDRCQDRVDNYYKKTRSDRENAGLQKAESALAKAKEEFDAADEHLRQHLPPLIAAVFSMLPLLLTAHVEIQNTILANLYTVMHNYCQQEQLPSPPPPMEQVIQDWKLGFLPVQKEIESFKCLANGKAIRQSMGSSQNDRTGKFANGGSGYRRDSGSTTHSSLRRQSTSPERSLPPPSPIYETKPRSIELPSPSRSSTLNVPTSDSSRRPSTASSMDSSSYVPLPEYFQTPGAFSPTGSNVDYFSRERQPSTVSSSTSISSGISPGYSSISAIAKKKPPPPPKLKPASANQIMFVTALYDFDGQGAGDLVFREGDRIRVLSKSDSTDDWWEGELRGVKGYFPANYVTI